jgi:hypothetical protein
MMKMKKHTNKSEPPCVHALTAALLNTIESEEELAAVLHRLFAFDPPLVHAFSRGVLAGVGSAFDEGLPDDEVDEAGAEAALQEVAGEILERQEPRMPVTDERREEVVNLILAHARAVTEGHVAVNAPGRAVLQ